MLGSPQTEASILGISFPFLSKVRAFWVERFPKAKMMVSFVFFVPCKYDSLLLGCVFFFLDFFDFLCLNHF